jgi:hypothetical protein
MLESAEVIEVFLQDNIQNYYTVRFKFLNSPGSNEQNTNTAIPLNAHIKTIPVPGEIILIVTAASSFAGNFRLNDGTFYYLSTVNVQSNINYNGVPTSATVPGSNVTSYQNASFGVTSSPNQSQPSRNKKTFEIVNNINPLQLFEGDVAIEGRGGNSIRLSSTIKNTNTISKQPTWLSGSPGDPILIISNTKKNISPIGFRIEDINKDDSSIYLTSTQKIPIKLAGPLTISNLKLNPISSNLSGKQIIMNSDRIILNAKTNEIYLSSNKGVSVTSKGDIVIEGSKDITFNAAKVNLTSTALYSAVNGELLETILNAIVTAISTITPATPGAPAAETVRSLIASIPFKSTKVKL